MASHPDYSESQAPVNWFEEWFNHPLYLEVYSHRDNNEAEQCVKTILSLSALDLKKTDSLSVLDIACGAGRHALELAKLGYMVTGNDLSPYLLDEARKAAQKCSLPLQLSCCDMRLISFESTYNLVVQLFTSFGYFDLKEDDQLVLNKAYHALQYDGWYVLDLINPLHLQRNIVAHSSRIAGELTIIEDRVLHKERITKRITIIPPRGQSVTFSESVRLYSRQEITAMLQKEGFTLATIVGNYAGDLFVEEESPRMMIFCQKSVHRASPTVGGMTLD
ncbi:MAG: methyltransferase domain-containing protein [Chlorobium sp.]|nr:MAG: methyltransferase domain-containing protein [Chlorobium sp.]